MKKVLLALVVGISSVLLIPACSDDASGGDDTQVVRVTIASNSFSPQSVTIKVGQTVRWTWAGGSHNVVSGSSCTANGTFKSGAPQAGGSFDQKFETAGSFPYF